MLGMAGRRSIPLNGKKLAGIRESLFLSQKEVGDKAGLSDETIGRLERQYAGRVLANNIPALAAALRLTPDQLVDRAGVDEAGFGGVAEVVRPIPVWDFSVHASGWADIDLCELDYDNPEQRTVIETGRFRLRIEGTCMEPEYSDGSVVEFEILRADRAGMEIGRAYAVCRSDGTATFKTLAAQTDDMFVLAALNQKTHPGFLEVSRQEVSRVARVVGIIHPEPAPRLPKLRKGKL